MLARASAKTLLRQIVRQTQTRALATAAAAPSQVACSTKAALAEQGLNETDMRVANFFHKKKMHDREQEDAENRKYEAWRSKLMRLIPRLLLAYMLFWCVPGKVWYSLRTAIYGHGTLPVFK
eukprot:gnl/Hemi2/16021_TR5305_c0_g1_i1.p1 gnl/Hemi2/16021_TR5305_c0_g1~~gnl/Hemi2/16021_TR5305_c0_g1_i1.p1  ORF type:complete len:122 (+),score=48.53 gnl/Hemi2/16021_TR5305_c0_g1_i1:56-421(+)